jgi:hypothetical protein
MTWVRLVRAARCTHSQAFLSASFARAHLGTGQRARASASLTLLRSAVLRARAIVASAASMSSALMWFSMRVSAASSDVTVPCVSSHSRFAASRGVSDALAMLCSPSRPVINSQSVRTRGAACPVRFPAAEYYGSAEATHTSDEQDAPDVPAVSEKSLASLGFYPYRITAELANAMLTTAVETWG